MPQIAPMTKATLLSIAMLTIMSNAAIITSLPHFKDNFLGVANIELLARLMITIPSLAIAILSPFLGHIIYKISLIKSAVFALLLFGVAGSAGLYIGDIYTLLFTRLFLGIAVAILMIVGTSLVGDYFKGPARHKFMGLQNASVSLGGILFISGGGVLSDINWTYPFGIYLVGFLLIPLVMAFLREPQNLPDEGEDSELSGSLYSIYFLAFLMMLIFYSLPTQMPFLIMNHFGENGSLAGFIISSAMASNALGALAFARLKQRFSFRALYMLGLFLLGCGFVGIGNVSSVYFLFITSPLVGFSNGILMTTTMGWMLQRAQAHNRIKASGYLTSALFGGQFFSPIIFHPLVMQFGVQSFFVILGVSIILGVGLFFMLKYKNFQKG